MNDLQKYLSKSLLAAAALLVGASPAWAQGTPLGAAAGFSVLGGTNVTCTDGVVTGDVGVSPGGAVPFTNTRCAITGATPPATNGAAAAARAAFLSAYGQFQLESSSCIPKPGNLSGLILPPGVYCVDSSAKAGTLTLAGPANGVWIFFVNGALTGTSFSVVMATDGSNAGQACNVYWVVSGGVTMTTSAFKGNILAGAPATAADPGSITLTDTILTGRALANVAVTMTGSSVIGCGAASSSLSCKDKDHDGDDKDHKKCNQGVGNGSEGCDPGKSDHGAVWPFGSNDERGGKPGDPGRKGGNK